MASVNQVSSGVLTDGMLTRFAAEPRSGVSGFFKNLLSTVTGSASQMVGINPEYAALINKQIETQTQMQLVSLYSNIEKSKHETQMAAVRNVRVG